MEYVKGTPYFCDTKKRLKQYPYLDKDASCEILIIGSGIDGAIADFYLSKNHDVMLVDKNRIGFNCTSCATALLEYQLDELSQDLTQYLSKEQILSTYKMGQSSISKIEEFIKQYGNECNFALRPTFLYTDSIFSKKDLIKEYNFRRENGFECELITEENNPFPFNVKAAQTKRAQLEREVADYEDEIKNSEARLITDFNYNASKFFAIPLIKRGFEVLKSAKDEGEGIPNMHASSIEYILKRGKCICGCDLTKNQGAVECIQHEQSLLPPQHIGTEVRMFRKDMENALSTSNMYVDNVKSDYRTWLKSQQSLEYCRKELKSISDKIVGFEDVEKYERKRQEAVQQLSRFEQAKVGNHDAIVRLKALIEASEKEIDKLIVANEKNKKIQRYCDYAQAIYDWFKDFYDRQEKEVKDDLLASINENFSKMYHGSREITMNNEYKITPVLTGDKSELAKSEGLETVTNFSFIMGLVELARKKAMKPADEDLANQPITEPYPIVMDAPFSNTDIKHIENITARLPEVAEQVIIFVMDKDWNYARKELEKHLGSKYVIEKVDNQDNHSTLRREI